MGCLNGKLDKENEDEKSRREANKKIEKQLQKDKQMYRATHRLLLLGELQIAMLMIRAHSFPRVAEFRAEPRNLPFTSEFALCLGILIFPRNFAEVEK